MYSVDDGDDVDGSSEEEKIDIEVGRRTIKKHGVGDRFDDINAADIHDMKKRKKQMLQEIQRREDQEYENEWGYNLVKALRGKTVGRRLRRKLFKFALVQFFCSIPLIVMVNLEEQNFPKSDYFYGNKYGSTLINLTSVTGYSTFIFAFFTFAAVRHWATLTTNRRLLTNLMRIYQFSFLIIFMVTLWCLCAFFLTFQKVKQWNISAEVQEMQPYYICSLICLFPLVLVIFFYTLDISYLTDEIEKGGTIEEENPPSYTRDLSDVTLCQSCLYVCAMPIILFIQCTDLFQAMKRAYRQYYREDDAFCYAGSPWQWDCCTRWFKKRTVPSDLLAQQQQLKKKQMEEHGKRKTIWHRMYRTIMKCIRGGGKSRHKPVILPTNHEPSAPPSAPPAPLVLKELEKDRETMEREERFAIEREQEIERQRLALKEAEEAAAYERARQLEQLRLETEQQAQQSQQQMEEEYQQRWQAMLNVQDFKGKWSTLPTSGSFQCQLKVMPTMTTFVDHLKRQGFHIVFAVTPSSDDLEIGICNIRPVGEEAWFLARFLASKNSFSAVMKSDNNSIVPLLVKKFNLAKVLKITGTK